MLDIENGFSVFFFKVTAKVDTEDHANFLLNQFAQGKKIGSWTLSREFDIRQGMEGDKFTVYAQVLYYQLEQYCTVIKMAIDMYESELIGKVVQVPREIFERLFPMIKEIKLKCSVKLIIRRRYTSPLIGVKGQEHRVVQAVDAIRELIKKELL
ncbi:DgyrCDS9227 [Dimorphilus gyrociliatus]|uniref:DgyrCDS9227 n=1 Tax=Dimorphilus gyrociliatus TaxID=2664684 RepID=A0A7I8VWR4_9ANNE|nr:DgyrCDS9227 [Dimorphilus gyrociliatus]